MMFSQIPEASGYLTRGSKLISPRLIDSLNSGYIFSERVLILNADETYLRQLTFHAGYRFFSDLTVSADGSGLVQIGRGGSFQGWKFGMGWEEGQLY